MNSTNKQKIADWLLNPGNPQIVVKDAEKKLKEYGLEKIYREIELPLVGILEDMKKIGIAVDKKVLAKLLKKYTTEIKSLEKKIYKEVGEKFNINSPQQLSKVLFDKFGIDLRSTRAEFLKKLRGTYPIIDLILRYREVFKIKSTYLEPLSKMGERIYTTFIQTGTATGRLSSQNPNLQNIPPIVKQVFVADKGYQFVSFDYSQIELRILAAASKDPKMLKAFIEGKDIHRLTASQVFNVNLNEVTPEMRRLAKTLNFGVVYGMGAVAFAKTSGLEVKDAKRFIEEYFSDFERIKKWQEKIKQEVRKKGYVENLNGRKRWLPAINSTNRFLAAEAERMAINMPIQSLAADIIKLAMIKVQKKFRKSRSVKLLLSIHDELLFEIESDKVKKSAEEIKKIMEDAYPLPVYLEVKMSQGKNWGEL